MRTRYLASFPVSLAMLCGALGTFAIPSPAEAVILDKMLADSSQTVESKAQPKARASGQSSQPQQDKATNPPVARANSGADQSPSSPARNSRPQPTSKSGNKKPGDSEKNANSSNNPTGDSSAKPKSDQPSPAKSPQPAEGQTSQNKTNKPNGSASNRVSNTASNPQVVTNDPRVNSSGPAASSSGVGVSSQSTTSGTTTSPNGSNATKVDALGSEKKLVDPPGDAKVSAGSDPKIYGMPAGDIELAGSKHPVAHEKMVFEPGKGLAIHSENKQFGIKLRLRAQMLYSLKNEFGADPATTHSFQIRRARLQFLGNFFGEHNKLKFELAVSPRDIGLDRGDGTLSRSPLLDWYFEFDKFKSITVRIGQSKIPFSRQRVISSGNLQLVDRSIANREFTLDRDVGIEIRSKDFLGMGWLRYYLGIYTAEGHSSFEFNDFGMNYLGRLEFLPMGQFKDYNEADHKRLKKPRLSIGTSYAFVDNAKRLRGIIGSRPNDGGTTDYHNVEADFMFKWYGLSVFGEGFYRKGKRKVGSLLDENGNPMLDEQGLPLQPDQARNGLGYMLQAGLFVPKTKFEFALRFAENHPTGKKTALGRKGELGGGLNYYFARHPLKIQGDYFRLYDDGDMSEGSHVFRVQLQGAF